MSTPKVCRASDPLSLVQFLRSAAGLLLATLFGMTMATVAGAEPSAIFKLQDKTNLTAGTYQIYVTGFSTAGPYVLQPDGSWGAPTAPTPPSVSAALPCYRYPDEISQVQIDGAQSAISARVYYFVVTDKTQFPNCNPVYRNAGTCPGVTMTATTITMATGSVIPPNGCTIVVPTAGTIPGTVVNTTSALQTSGGTAPATNAPLTVGSGTGPTLTNTITPSIIPAPGGALLMLTLGNPGTTALTLTSAFTDTMPAGVTTGGNTGTCNGVTVTATTITMASGSTIPPGGCNIVMTITAANTGTVVNTTSSLQTGAGTAPAANAPLTVGSGSGPTLIKTFTSSIIGTGASNNLTITLGNPGTAPLTLTAPFTDTMPAGVAIIQPGLFNLPGAFTYTWPFTLSSPSATSVIDKTFPAWSFSEIGTSKTSGTLDLSQVDFFAFPMNVNATVSSGPAAIGNPVGSAANPGEAVNHLSIRDSYKGYIDAQAAKAGQSCGDTAPPIICAYKVLLQEVKTPGSVAAQYVIQNPSGYLKHNTTISDSRLNDVFGSVTSTGPGTYTVNGVIGQLWAPTIPPTTAVTTNPSAPIPIPGTGTLVLKSGGVLGAGPGATPTPPGVPDDEFTSTVVAIYYPGTTYAVNAMMFTGTSVSDNYVAYVVSPADYQVGCVNGAIPSCGTAISTGYQVFAGAGAFNTPVAGTYTALNNAGMLAPNAGQYNAGTGYDAVVARLGFLISGAMNRGVALVNCNTQTAPIVAQPTWKCWQDETYWYPTTVSTTFPDITQNQYSRWMHTASISNTPMFLQPANAVNSASGTAGTGKPQGMAYGFSNDENPTPTATASAQPEVPSKFDATVTLQTSPTNTNTITFGPWVTSPALNPTLTVDVLGRGVVTSTPAGINCGADCSQAYPPGTVVTLTAAPDVSAILHGWSGGGCTGRSLTCAVTLNGNTTVTAEFYSILAATPAAYGLHTLVSGNGSVTSAPAGIVCGNECSKSFSANTVVTLTAAAGPNSVFSKWTGACAGSGPTCTVTMTAAKTVGAAFYDSAQVALSVTSTPGGIVTTLPGGIDCGTRCTAGFAPGAYVNVVATPNHGYRFAGWSGACTGASTCDITMTGNMAVSATFAPIAVGSYAMTVHDFGEGAIVSSPAGINCGSSCSAAFVSGTKVTLVATPAAGYKFAGWSGSCTGTGACVVWMDDFANAYAFFDPIVVPVPVASEPIPTLSEWTMALMALLMLAVGFIQLRKRAMLRR